MVQPRRLPSSSEKAAPPSASTWARCRARTTPRPEACSWAHGLGASVARRSALRNRVSQRRIGGEESLGGRRISAPESPAHRLSRGADLRGALADKREVPFLSHVGRGTPDLGEARLCPAL